MKTIKLPNGFLRIKEWLPYRPHISIDIDLKDGTVYIDDIVEVEVEYFASFVLGFTEALEQANRLINGTAEV